MPSTTITGEPRKRYGRSRVIKCGCCSQDLSLDHLARWFGPLPREDEIVEGHIHEKWLYLTYSDGSKAVV